MNIPTRSTDKRARSTDEMCNLYYTPDGVAETFVGVVERDDAETEAERHAQGRRRGTPAHLYGTYQASGYCIVALS